MAGFCFFGKDLRSFQPQAKLHPGAILCDGARALAGSTGENRPLYSNDPLSPAGGKRARTVRALTGAGEGRPMSSMREWLGPRHPGRNAGLLSPASNWFGAHIASIRGRCAQSLEAASWGGPATPILSAPTVGRFSRRSAPAGWRRPQPRASTSWAKMFPRHSFSVRRRTPPCFEAAVVA